MGIKAYGVLYGRQPQRKVSDEARGARFSLPPCQFNKKLSLLNKA